MTHSKLNYYYHLQKFNLNHIHLNLCLEQIDRISGIAAKYVGKPVGNYPLGSPRGLEVGVGGSTGGFGVGDVYGGGGGPGDLLRSISGLTDADKPMIIELAVAAMEELVRMAHMGEPLWMTTLDGTSTILNQDEYLRTFPRGIGPKPSAFKCEASRETTLVIMNHINLVEILMDVVPNIPTYYMSIYHVHVSYICMPFIIC